MILRVVDIMTRELVVLRQEDNLGVVADDMERYGIRHLPVVDEGDVLVGLVSHRDLLGALITGNRDTWVHEVMTRDVATVSSGTSVADAAQVLVDGKLGCVPVVEPDGRLIGIVTEHDMLRTLVKTLLLEDLHEGDLHQRMARLR